MKLSKLLHETGIKCEGTTDNNREDPDITGLSCDSRTVRPGDLFLALPGAKDDGRNHIDEAIRRGATAVIEEDRPTMEMASRLAKVLYGEPDRDLILIGVTGTNGKTTTTWMIRQCLAQLGMECGLIGTVAYDCGGGRMEASRTTPPPDQIWRLLNDMKQNGLGACAMEVSSHGLALGRVSQLEFQYGLFTNLTEDHLDFHKTMEAYYQAKKQLFSQVKRMSFVNVDDPWGRRLYEELQREGRPVRGLSLTDGPDLELSLPGKYNRENGLLARAVCMEIAEERGLKHPESLVREALKRVKAVPGRFEPVPNALGRKVFVDYAHTPDALERVLHTAREMLGETDRLICVFGCGGDRDTGKRPLMGEIAGRLADRVIITSDNPRSEDPERIAKEIAEGTARSGGTFEILLDRKKAIEKALTLCKNGDILIIAGKGHETTQIIGNQSYPFDDRKVAEELLKEINI